MTVASILIMIALGVGIYLVVKAFDRYSNQCYRYTFMSAFNLMLAGVSEASMVVGQKWQESALKTGGDIYDGQLLVLLGAIGLIVLFRKNLNATASWGITLVGFTLQMFIGAFWVVAAFFALLAFIQAKPVYTINGGDW